MRHGARSTALTSHLLPATLRLTLVVFLLATVFPSRPDLVAAQDRCRRIGGFDVCGRFLDQWSRQGTDRSSIYVNGLPLTARQPEISVADGKTYDVQWFERARFEAHPENQPPNDVLLGLLGASLSEGRGALDPNTGEPRSPSDAPFIRVFQPDNLGASNVYFEETGHTLSGKMLEFWKSYGGLKQFGYPLSEPFEEVSSTNGKSYSVQYFERARFELHPEEMAPYDVELGLLGVQQYAQKPIAGSDLPIAPPEGVTSSKDALIMATQQEPRTLFSAEDDSTIGQRDSWPVTFLDNLVGTDDKGEAFPLAAWYVPTLENGGAYFVGTGGDRHLAVKYKLRQGIQWSDGVELTSTDAVFAYKFIMGLDSRFNVHLPEYLRLSNVDNPGKYTIVYNFLSNNELRAKYDDPKTVKERYPFAQTFLQTKKPVTSLDYNEVGKVLPQHVLAGIDPLNIFGSKFWRQPIGYGPYVVDHWTAGSEILLVQNPYYSLTAKPPVKSILIKESVGMDALYAQIKAGAIDAIASDDLRVLPSNADDLKASGLTFDVVPSAAVERLDLNFDFPALKERPVRQAIIQAIDRVRIVTEVFNGNAWTLRGVIPPVVDTSLENPDYAKNFPDLAARYKLPDYPYDPVAANKLLDDAGWIRGPDGIRAKGGQRLSLAYVVSNNQLRTAVAKKIKEYLQQIGVEVTIKALSFFGFDYLVGPCQMCEHLAAQNDDADFSAWDENYISDVDNNELDSYYYLSPSSPNMSRYRNPVTTTANQTYVTDLHPQAQAEASALAQVTIMDDIASIPIAEYPQIEIFRSDLQNRKVATNCGTQMWNVTQWYFK